MGGDNERQFGSYASTMLGSAMSGMLARIPCHPLDTCKARLQVQTAAATAENGLYRSVGDVVRRTLRTEGIKGLYRGFGITFFGSAPAACLYFTSYEWSRDALVENTGLKHAPFVAHFLAGLFAETFSCILWVPIDVTKERLQVQHPPSATASGDAVLYRGSTDAFRTILRTEGVGGIYKGYGATLASFAPMTALFFVFYEQLKLASVAVSGAPGPDALSLPFQLSSGAAAGALASLLTNALDMAKLRLQVQRGGAGDFQYRHTWHALQQIVRHEGNKGLWRGAGARVAFHAPATAISMAAFEQCKRFAGSLLGVEPLAAPEE